ncbi:Uncharacterised protein r2_g3333 [Pycnogonum litorale]
MALSSSCGTFVNFHLGQLNLQRCEACNTNLTHLINGLKFDLVSIQEPYTIDGDIACIPFDFRLIEPPGVLSKCGFVIGSPDLVYFHPSHLSTSNITMIEILSFDFKLIMISAYFEPSVNILQYLQHLDHIIGLYPGYEVIIAADMNSHSSSWGCDSLDSLGAELDGWLGQSGLYVINTGSSPTFSAAQGSSIIAITVASFGVARLILNWKVSADTTISDLFCSPIPSYRVG